MGPLYLLCFLLYILIWSGHGDTFNGEVAGPLSGKQEIAQLKKQVEFLMLRDWKHEMEILALKDERDADRAEIKELKARIHTAPTNNYSKSLSTSGQRAHRAVSQEIAFFAEVKSHDYTNLGTNQNIRFDYVPLNAGYAYHPQQGVFIAPVGGLYLLSTTLTGYVSHSNGHNQFSIDVNGRQIAKLTMSPSEQASQSIVYRLGTNDEVSIRNAVVGDGLLGGAYSTFSAYLLFEEDGRK